MNLKESLMWKCIKLNYVAVLYETSLNRLQSSRSLITPEYQTKGIMDNSTVAEISLTVYYTTRLRKENPDIEGYLDGLMAQVFLQAIFISCSFLYVLYVLRT